MLRKLLPFFFGLLLCQAANAQTATARYHLDNLWLLPDVSHPGGQPRQMSGEFAWTYTVGDFENGSGQFNWVDIPWFGSDMNKMIITMDMGSIEFSLNGNYHGLGLEVSIHFLEDLAPNLDIAIDLVRSKFQVENGTTTEGHMISGSCAPDPQLALSISGTCTQPIFDITGNTTNQPVALLWAFGTGTQVIPGGYPCAGTMLGLNSTVKIGATLTADAAGQVIFTKRVPASACGRIWLQALDLSTCGLSPVVALQ
jgi:hypothetical protein